MKPQKIRRTREQWQELVSQWKTTHMNAKAWCLELPILKPLIVVMAGANEFDPYKD